MNKLLRASENPNGQVINSRKRLIFNLVLFIITLLFLFIIEFGLRIFNYGNDLSLFVKSVNYSGYYEINGKVNLRYFSKFERTSSTSDIFLIEKPDTCFRIFVFGESTARGFPYQAGNSFPNILYYRLQDAFPDKRIEVINLSASAINSYSYIDMLGEVLDQKPDLILLYGGHNEYYGALGVGSVEGGGNVRWIKKLRLKLCKLRSFQLVQNSIMKGSMILSKNDQGDDGTLMSRIAKDKDILINSPQFNAGIEQFSKNISELVQKAHKKNIPVVMSELVNNIKDQEPFKSAGTPSAIDVFNEAKRLEAEGKVKEAKELYYQAKDLDVIRFRSPERINEVIQSICKQNNLPLVPMKRVFEMESPNQLIGNNLIIEHLHPNIDGYFLMADAFFNTLRENKLISKNWNAAKIKPSLYYRNHWGFTELDSLLGELNIKSLKAGWPYRPENQLKTFVQTYRPESYVDSVAFAYLTGDYETRHIEDEHIKVAQHYFKLGQNDKAFKEYLALIKLHPYIADLYFDASKYLIAQQKFSEALELINSAPLMEKNFFYYYMIGTLKLKIGDTQTAINNLEHAFKIITPVDKPEKVLMPLYVAYKESGDTENQKRVMGLIKQSIPELGKESMLEKAKPAAPAVSANEMIAMAESLLKKREFEKAKELLFSANKIEETAKADKLIGMIFFTQKENKLAYTYSLKAYQLDQNDFENNNNLYILCLLNDDLKNASLVLEKLRSMNIEPSKIQRLENLYDKKKKELESN